MKFKILIDFLEILKLILLNNKNKTLITFLKLVIKKRRI